MADFSFNGILVLEESLDDLSVIYVLSSALSLVGCLLLFFVYASSEKIRRHPAPIIFWTVVADTLLNLKFLIGAIAWLKNPTLATIGDSFHFIKDDCYTEAILTNFAAIASVAWNGIWAINFARELASPLSSTASSMKFYHIFVWALAAGSTLAMVLTKSVGVARDLSCWTTGHSGFVIFDLTLLVTFMVVAVVSMVAASRRLCVGTRATKDDRRLLFRSHLSFVITFVLCWSPTMVTIAINLKTKPPIWLVKLSAFGIGSQALFLALLRLVEPQVITILRRRCGQCCGVRPSRGQGEHDPLVSGAAAINIDGNAELVNPTYGATDVLARKTSSGQWTSGTDGTDGSSATGRYSTYDMRSLTRLADIAQGSEAADRMNDQLARSRFGAGEALRRELVFCLLAGICHEALATVDSVDASSKVSDVPLGESLAASLLGEADWDLTEATNSDLEAMALEERIRTYRVAIADGPDAEQSIRVFAPRLFQRVQEQLGITGRTIITGLSPDHLADGTLLCQFSAAKSGSFFVRSSNMCLVLKTMDRSELQALIALLPNYVEFLERPENRDSLLCRFLGCFEYTPPGGSTPVIAVLMNNLLETNLRIEHVFDMKGSRVGRLAKRRADGSLPSVLMDENFRAMRPEGLAVGPSRREVMLEQLARDTELLAKHNLMDYSLLVGVAPCTSPDTAFRSEILACDEDDQPLATEVYLIGLIDLLQVYNTMKKAEHAYKSVRHSSPKTVSAVGPDDYRDRLLLHVASILR